jgi:hypothetical protein
MISVFEVLPTEIVFEIFDYLTVFDIFYALINLKKRINAIIGLYPLQLDFQRISRSKGRGRIRPQIGPLVFFLANPI